ncbi:unnamed protein product [Blepharisma stoltei]|uniref:Receptor expression-enhancing protein n=1 Tax=Blepharisma stoltei TaxID=1481888 RepID=A0AAU9KAW2_9CILI|nr:unnamed protein product [Blepharisma stoltei]
MLCTLIHLAQLTICWIYPISQTVHAFETRNYSLFWISYWFVFGVLNYLESTFLFWLAPFCVYQILRSLFCLWMLHPDYKGAEFIEETLFPVAYEQLKGIVSMTPLGKYLEEA